MSSTIRRACAALSAALVAGASAGCDPDPYQTVPVRGRVTCEGKPAWGGTVIFHPLDTPKETGRPKGSPGRSASGMVEEDGSFSLTVPAAGGNSDAVGAVVGRHRVSFLLPKSTPWEMSPADRSLPPDFQEEIEDELATRPVFPQLPCGPTITPAEVEVKAGENEFEFTLLPE